MTKGILGANGLAHLIQLSRPCACHLIHYRRGEDIASVIRIVAGSPPKALVQQSDGVWHDPSIPLAVDSHNFVEALCTRCKGAGVYAEDGSEERSREV